MDGRMPTCDFYILVCIIDTTPVKMYVVPSMQVAGQVQICIGTDSKKYEKYLYRWDLILKYVDNYKAMIGD